MRGRIVLAPFGSLGDLHPFLAVAPELRDRGYEVAVATIGVYRERVEALGFEFHRIRPDFDPEDRQVSRAVMDARHGTERLLTGYILPHIRDSFFDLMAAADGADLIVAGEITYAADAVSRKMGIKWLSTSLSPLSMFSAHESMVFPNAPYLRHLNFLGTPFRKVVLAAVRRAVRIWLDDYRVFRREIGLPEDHDPILLDKFSEYGHLAMFSGVLGPKQPDWPLSAEQTGFCFYDGEKDLGPVPEGLPDFLDDDDPPIVFTLGSAAVMDARDFFEQSIEAAKILGRRAVVIYGVFNQPPQGCDEQRRAFDYLPFGKIFPAAACVVHQGGVGTVAQALLAGVPQLIVPFSHDQPDNAARCARLGVGRTLDRKSYNAGTVSRHLGDILKEPAYSRNAADISGRLLREEGTLRTANAIENAMDS